MDSSATIEDVDRSQLDALSAQLTRFSYTPNSRGFIFLQICAALLFVIAFTIYVATQFSTGYWSLFSGAATLGGAFLIILVVRWSSFARSSFVAFDERHLYIVRRKRGRRVAWRHLSAEAAGFDEDPEAAGQLGVLNVHLAGRSVELILFNPFVIIEDFPTLLVEILTQIKSNRESTDLAAVDSSADTADEARE